MFRLPTPAASGGGPSQPTRQKPEACGCCHSRLGIVREEAGMRRRDGSGRPGRDPSRMCELYTCACSPYPARITCCRRGHDGERGRPDDTALAVFQEAVTAPGRRDGRLPASCISLRVKIPGPTRREAVGVRTLPPRRYSPALRPGPTRYLERHHERSSLPSKTPARGVSLQLD